MGKFFAGAALLWIATIAFLGIGWVMNLITVIRMGLDNAPMTASFVLRIAGVPLALLGGIAGWF